MMKNTRNAGTEPAAEGRGAAEPENGNPAADTDAAAPEIAAARTAGAALPETAEYYNDRWLRAEAELQNTRRRAARDREDAIRAAEDRILIDLIEVLDDLDRALASVPPEAANDPWTQGVTLTAQRLRDVLARRGVTPVAAVGQPFDPAFHEALLEVPARDDLAPGSVAEEVQRGYRRGDRALRAARVVVARGE